MYRAPHTNDFKVVEDVQSYQSQQALRFRLHVVRMTAPLGIHATSDVHGRCARFVSFVDSLSGGSVRRRALNAYRGKREIDLNEQARRKGKKGRRENEKWIGREKNTRDREAKIKKGRSTRERERTIRRVVHTLGADWKTGDAAGIGVFNLETTVTRLADDYRRRGAPALHVTRENRVSSSLRVSCRLDFSSSSRACYEPRSGFLWQRLADDTVRVVPARPRDADAMRRRSVPGCV